MGIFSIFDPALHFVFGPLLKLDPLVFVVILSLILSLIIVLAFKFGTDQVLMKKLKDEIKELQAEMKLLKDHPEKMSAVNKRMLETNMKYMMQSFKATFITFLPIIIIFGYLNSTIGFDPIHAQQEFNVRLDMQANVAGQVDVRTPSGLEIIGPSTKDVANGMVAFSFKGEDGSHDIEFSFVNKTYVQNVIISEERKYAPVEQTVNDANVNLITTDLQKTIVLNLFGWQIGWLGAYIIFSIAFSSLFRKLLKVY